jgi:hypothetical protein
MGTPLREPAERSIVRDAAPATSRPLTELTGSVLAAPSTVTTRFAAETETVTALPCDSTDHGAGAAGPLPGFGLGSGAAAPVLSCETTGVAATLPAEAGVVAAVSVV